MASSQWPQQHQRRSIQSLLLLYHRYACAWDTTTHRAVLHARDASVRVCIQSTAYALVVNTLGITHSEAPNGGRRGDLRHASYLLSRGVRNALRFALEHLDRALVSQTSCRCDRFASEPLNGARRETATGAAGAHALRLQAELSRATAPQQNSSPKVVWRTPLEVCTKIHTHSLKQTRAKKTSKLCVCVCLDDNDDVVDSNHLHAHTSQVATRPQVAAHDDDYGLHQHQQVTASMRAWFYTRCDLQQEATMQHDCRSLTHLHVLDTHDRFGGPAVLQMGDQPEPTFRSSRDVIVKVYAAALNPVRASLHHASIARLFGLTHPA